MASTSTPIIYSDGVATDPLATQLQAMLNDLEKAADDIYYYIFHEAINPNTLSPQAVSRIREYLSSIDVSARAFFNHEAHQCALFIYSDIETLMSKLNERLPMLNHPFLTEMQAKTPSPLR